MFSINVAGPMLKCLWGVDHLRRSQAEEHTGRRAHRSQEKGLTVVDHRFIAQVPFSSLGNAGGIHLDSHKLLAFIAHVGGHGRGLPWLAPIRNSSELRGLYCRSYFGPRTCGRGITSLAKCAGLSIRVSPSHPYNAGRAGLGWGGGGVSVRCVLGWCCVLFL